MDGMALMFDLVVQPRPSGEEEDFFSGGVGGR